MIPLNTFRFSDMKRIIETHTLNALVRKNNEHLHMNQEKNNQHFTNLSDSNMAAPKRIPVSSKLDKPKV